ncbi:hypothetical protein BH18CHL1_BH18CHL1_02940 [soil metagenome]
MVPGKAARATRRRVIIYVVLVAGSLMLMGASDTMPLRDLRAGVGFALSPLRTALAGTTRSVTGLFTTIAEIDRLRRDNEAQAQRIAALEAELLEAEGIRVENERLTRLLGVQSSFGHRSVAAVVIGRPISDLERVVTLDRGSDDGVSVGDPVVSSDGGLAGSVMGVGSRHSDVLLISDTRSLVIGLIEASRATGEVVGRLSANLAMVSIPTTEAVAIDDRVVTAGLTLGDDVRSPFPRGLLIGRVVDVDEDAAAIVKTALVEPAADLDELEYVLVITDFEPPAPLPTISPAPSPSPTPPPSRRPRGSVSPAPSR